MSNLEDVKRAASGRWSAIIISLASVDAVCLDGRQQPCPKCGGTDRFRVFEDFEETGGAFCNQCYDKKNGDGIATLGWLNGWDFKTTLEKLSEHLNVDSKPKRKKAKSTDPEEHLDWQPWNDRLAELCCKDRPGFTAESLLQNGARMAHYRNRYVVMCLPMLNDALNTVGWMMWNISSGPNSLDPTAGKLPVWMTDPPTWVKMKATSGSKPGMLGTDGMSKLDTVDAIIKVEGPGDMIALWQLIPPEVRDRYAVVTNSAGANETPQQWFLDKCANRKVFVLHDADVPGQVGSADAIEQSYNGGAKLWCGLLAHQSEVRNVQLPYEVEPKNGKDLRDWINEGGTWEQFLQLLEAGKEAEPIKVRPKRRHDDPHRLAELHLKKNWGEEGLAIRYWRDSWWKYVGKHYKHVPRTQMRAEMTATIYEDFTETAEQLVEEKGTAAPMQKSVTSNLVSNAMTALAGMCLVDDDSPQPSWLGGEFRGRDPYDFISLENGILDIKQWLDNDGVVELIPHSPLWFSPLVLPFKYSRDARCDFFRSVIHRILENDQDRIDMLQQWFGYCLTPDTSQQRFMMMEGDGSNGKSVVCACLEAVLGPKNCSHVSLEFFGQRFALTQTLGKLANVISEVGELDRISEGFLKSFTAGDRMTFDRKNQEPIDCVPTARLILAFNNRPRFADRSGGLWRRVLFLPLLSKITQDERIFGLDDARWWLNSCDSEYGDQMSGMLNWALEGLRDLRQYRRFTESEMCRQLVAQYAIDNNPARAFLEDTYHFSAGGLIPTMEVYEAYKKWCTDHGNKPFAAAVFGREVRRVFPNVERKQGRDTSGRRTWVYEGLVLKGEFDIHYSDDSAF